MIGIPTAPITAIYWVLVVELSWFGAPGIAAAKIASIGGRAIPNQAGVYDDIDLFTFPPVTDKDLEDVDFRAFPELRYFSVTSPLISDCTLCRLQQTKGKLEILLVTHAPVTDKGVVPLLKTQPSIRILSLAGTGIGDASLAQIRALCNLESLSLSGTRLKDSDLQALSGLRSLQSLHLQRTRISDAGMKHIARFPRLRYLYIDATNVSDQGLMELAGMQSLRTLSIVGTRTSEQGIRKLQRALPSLQIVSSMSSAEK